MTPKQIQLKPTIPVILKTPGMGDLPDTRKYVPTDIRTKGWAWVLWCVEGVYLFLISGYAASGMSHIVLSGKLTLLPPTMLVWFGLIVLWQREAIAARNNKYVAVGWVARVLFLIIATTIYGAIGHYGRLT